MALFDRLPIECTFQLKYGRLRLHHQYKQPFLTPRRPWQRVPTPDSKNRLIIFGRYPCVGRVKTRLIPALGPAGAAALQKRLAERTMASARHLADRIDVRIVFCHDGGSRQRIERWLGLKHIGYQPQIAGDIGQRMRYAMQTAFCRGARRVVLVGTDIPGLTTPILEQAFTALHEKDLVLGPSTDGGYWLVGMTRPANIFGGIVWSRPDVLENTLTLARRKGMTPYLLDPLNDLDTPEDLERELGRSMLALATAAASGRCWPRLEPLHTLLVRTIIAIGFPTGIGSERLARLYRLLMRTTHS
jgi:rSAM/selenodomain-associated transferase 1